MTTPTQHSSLPVQGRIERLVALARVLEQVERTPGRYDADNYQRLVRDLQASLDDDGIPPVVREAVLQSSPAASEVYENLHYDRSGLSRTTLELAISTEMRALEVLGKFRLSRPTP